MNSVSRVVFYLLLLLAFCSCSRFYSKRKKDIVYSAEQKLDVYSPKKKTKELKSVLVFIHGGNWTRGSKSLYKFFGRGMARKDVIGVVIDFRQHPSAEYKGMAMDAATSLKWVKENITTYGGDTNKIFVSGHSAGAHLAALISTDNTYFDSLKIKNPVKGCILIDAFGLDMHTYLKREEKYQYDVYRTIFTIAPEQWKKGSPIFHLHDGMPKFILFVGEKTYPNIVRESNAFISEVKKYQTDAKLITVPRKRHTGMMFSYANPRKDAYDQILEFMKSSK